MVHEGAIDLLDTLLKNDQTKILKIMSVWIGEFYKKNQKERSRRENDTRVKYVIYSPEFKNLSDEFLNSLFN